MALYRAESMALVAWYETDPQLSLARADAGFIYVRLGRRQGAFHVHPNIARTRHVLLHTHGPSFAPGLLVLREAGFRVFTRMQLRAELSEHARGAGIASWEASAGQDDEEYIYALFKTTADERSTGQEWDADEMMRQLSEFESDARNKPVENLGHASAYPRILSLRNLLKARRPI